MKEDEISGVHRRIGSIDEQRPFSDNPPTRVSVYALAILAESMSFKESPCKNELRSPLA